MNDNDNNILIAQQGNCDVALVDGAKVFRYKDGDGNIQTVDIAGITDGTSLFENNQNIGVDWEIDLSLMNKVTSMFNGSNIKSFKSDCVALSNASNMFYNCKDLECVEMALPSVHTTTFANCFYGCSSLKKVNLKLRKKIVNCRFNMSGLFEDCTSLESVNFQYHVNLNKGFTPTCANMFKNCKSLKTINLSFTNLTNTVPHATGMFSGCLLGPEQLQQIADSDFIRLRTSWGVKTEITIGVDSTKVSQEDIDNYWNHELGQHGFTITWELNTPE